MLMLAGVSPFNVLLFNRGVLMNWWALVIEQIHTYILRKLVGTVFVRIFNPEFALYSFIAWAVIVKAVGC